MRKIKLMALLLAALMVMAAFAGCAGVKQEDLDAVNDRVDELEDAINGVGDKIDALPGNNDSAILDAIKDMQEELEEKIDAVNGRVDDVVSGTTPPADETAAAATKAAQAEALASIEVQKATFTKNIDQYDEDTYAAITTALTKAQANVTAATTADEVKAIMAELATALDAYKTYAMKLLDAYTALLGKLADDGADELVEGALELLEIVDEAYDDVAAEQGEKGELVYFPVEGSKKFIKLYDSVKALCDVFTKKSSYTGTKYSVDYVDAKGKVATIELPSLASIKNKAKTLVNDIADAIMDEEILYVNRVAILENIDEVKADYEAYAKVAEVIGGKALLDLVTNVELLVNAEDEIDRLIDAKEAYDRYNGRESGTSNYLNILAPYTALTNKVSLTFVEDDETVWTKDVYLQVTEDLEDWAEEYDLSEKNVKGIVGETNFNNLLVDGRKAELVYEAYEKFVDEIVPEIKALNKLSEGTAEAVEDYKALQEALWKLKVLQEKDTSKDADIRDKFDFALTDALFDEYLEESGILNVVDANGDDATAARIAAVGAIFDATTDASLKENFVNLFTFKADADELEDDYLSLRATGAIYKFFNVDYKTAETKADAINAQIERLVKLVNDKKINSVREFELLAGKYVALDSEAIVTLAGKNDCTFADGFVSEDGDDYTYAIGESVFVAVEDLIDYDIFEKDTDRSEDETADDIYFDLSDLDNSSHIYVELNGVDVMTIDFYNWAFPIFKDLIDVEEFEAAKKTLEGRVVELFDQVDDFVAAVEAIGFLKVEDDKTTYTFVDANKNGKYDNGEARTVIGTAGSVSLADAADVTAAYNLYTEWALAGGNYNLETFTAKEEDDKALSDVFEFVGFSNGDLKDTVKTLNDLRAEIDTLKKMAEAFTKSVDLVAKIAKLSVDNLKKGMQTTPDISKADYFAYTEVVKSTDKNDVTTYKYTYLIADTYGLKTKTTATARASEALAFNDMKGDTASLVSAAALQIVADLYEEFIAENLEYTLVSESDTEIYYVENGYAAYAAVDNAKVTYDKYDLMMAKAAVLSEADRLNASAAAKTELKTMVDASGDFAKLENAIGLYNSRSDVKGVCEIGKDAITDWTIYADFDSLLDVRTQPVVIRGNDLLPPVWEPNDDYVAAYKAAGVKLVNNTITYTAGAEFDQILYGGKDLANPVVVGLVFPKPAANAVSVSAEIYRDGESFKNVDVTAADLAGVDTIQVLDNQFINYFRLQEPATYKCDFAWTLGNGSVVATTCTFNVVAAE